MPTTHHSEIITDLQLLVHAANQVITALDSKQWAQADVQMLVLSRTAKRVSRQMKQLMKEKLTEDQKKHGYRPKEAKPL